MACGIRLAQLTPSIQLANGAADEEQPVEYLAPLGEGRDVLRDFVIGSFDVGCDQDGPGRILRDQRQNLVDGRRAHTLRCRIKPKPGVAAIAVREGCLGDIAMAVGGAVEDPVMDTNEVTIVVPADVKLESYPEFQAGPEGRPRVLRGVSNRLRWPTTIACRAGYIGLCAGPPAMAEQPSARLANNKAKRLGNRGDKVIGFPF